MTIGEAFSYVNESLKKVYPEGETSAITHWMIESLSGIKKTALRLQQSRLLDSKQEQKLKEWLPRLLEHEPIQYVLHESWFCGLKFYVDNQVLIPRPETEELVEWIITNCRFPVDNLSILDIGSGSGCIPITLKRRIRKAEVFGCDISTGALTVARRNSDALGADIEFYELDFLDQTTWRQLPKADIIVSNPPYVPENDKKWMHRNVLVFEPHTALFVPDNDPLVFYRALAAFGKSHLKKDGDLYVEIHESLGEAVLELFRANNYRVEIKKDMQGKDRMIRARRENEA